MNAVIVEQQQSRGAATPPAQPPAIIQALSPNFNGKRQGVTQGVVAHSTNGGGLTEDAEFRGTLNYFLRPASQVSSHIVIHANGTIAEVVDPDNRAWHAGSLNDSYLGIELAKPAASSHISDEQLRSMAWWIKRMSVRYGFPINEATIPEHRNTSQGRAIGKIDISGDYSFARLAAFL